MTGAVVVSIREGHGGGRMTCGPVASRLACTCNPGARGWGCMAALAGESGLGPAFGSHGRRVVCEGHPALGTDS